MRLGFLSSHPIQYQVPLFRVLSGRPGVEFTALFCHEHGLRPTFDRGFRQVIQYDVPLLEGYRSRFLRNVSYRPGLTRGGMVNPEIVSILARGEFDALIVLGYASATNLAALISFRSQTRVLLRGDSNVRDPRPRVTRAVKRVLVPALFRHVDHFLSVGSLNDAYYHAYGVSPERITRAPFAVDNAFFSTRAAVSRYAPGLARKRLGLPEREILFVYAGKLVPWKRPLDVLEAFAYASLSERAGLVYVGDGELSSRLSRRVDELGLTESVRLLGFRNQTELPEILGACDVLVLPSAIEPWGLIVNEASACGAAAFVSDRVGAGPDLVPDSRCIFPVGDIAYLGKILREVTENAPLLQVLKAAAVDRISRWGIEQSADGVLRGVELALAAGARKW